jgi:hypothetical protein
MRDTNDNPEAGGNPAEPAITLVGVGRHSYYIVEGVEHLDQLLLVEGVYPKPVLCLHFESVQQIQEKMAPILGEVDMTRYWAIHPDIIARLRDTNVLIEKVV